MARRLVAVLLATVSIGVLVTGFTASATPATGDLARSAPAAATGTGGRTATATPGTELSNEVVRVSWTGFTPTLGNGLYGVIVVQCSAAPTSLADCYTEPEFPSVTNGNRATGTTGPDGTGSTLFEVRPAAFLPELGCTTAEPCSLLVYENDGQPFSDDELPGKHAIAPLAFARSQADCPQVFDFDVRADGSSTAAPLFYSWAGELCQGDDAIVLDYTETSSTSGRENFLNGLVDLGVTAVPATEEELDAHPDHRPYRYAPVAASAQVVAYNLRDPLTGERLDNLVFSPRLVARLVTNTSTDTFFKDRELLRLNPGVRFPSGGATRPLLRAERSASTSIYTSWLAADPDVADFLSGNDMFRVDVNPAYSGYTYPKDLFENVSGDTLYLARQGQRAVALRLFYGVSPTGSLRENTAFNGVIGLVDLPTARRFGLQVARLKLADGSIVAPTDEAISAGLADMDVTPSGVLVADVTPEDPAAYPLVRVDYAMVPDEVPTAEKRDQIRQVLDHAVGAGSEELSAGFVPLPAELVERTTAIASSISIPPPPPTTTTTTVRPPRSTTTVPRTTTTVQSTTTTTTTTLPLPTTTWSSGSSGTTSPVTQPAAAATTTTVVERASSPRSTTTTTSPTTSTTVPAIVPPEPQLVLPEEPTARPARVVAGMAGLSSAALLGTIPPSRLRLKGKLRRKAGGS